MEIEGGSKKKIWNELVDATTTNKLPSDVVMQIVSRLPIKSIIRFKLVNKAWYALFTSPKFAKSYLRTSSKEPYLLVQTHNKEGTADIRVIESLQCRKPVVRDFVPPVATTTDSELVGSINGLVCLSLCYDASSFVLWNPATGKHFRIPIPRLSNTLYGDKASLGFAYDEETKCYKVIRLRQPLYNVGHEFTTTMEIYNSGINKWRRDEIKSFPAGCQLMFGSILRGSPYWFGIDSTTNLHKPFVMRFDPSNENLTWKYMVLPFEHGEPHQFSRIGMGFEDESPVLFALKAKELDELGSIVKTWRLKKAGPINVERTDVVVGLFLKRLIGIWRNGETIGLDEDGELIMYDYEAEVAAYLPHPRCDGPMDNANACEYIPSLLPPPYPSST